MTNEKEGEYCTVCGGIKPDAIKIRAILVDGRETGINQLDEIVAGVRKLDLKSDDALREELLRRARVFNYIPTKKTDAYADALLEEYRGG
ncbi:aldolase [Methanoculleus taiwanensis]|uniref:Aldolase n=1 Tax=Methanoculleus taiwanensis TaxID=1550565 RepID=A0A498GZI0_9EURY|nr:NAC family transcription factor [Methanoculleus taiwanensis]RXE56059.1 aldolase [Methanoculleus taiwanensis]